MPAPQVSDAKPLDSIKSAKDRKRLNDACTEIRELQAQIAAMEIRKKDLVEQDVRPLLRTLRLDKVRGEGWLAIRTKQRRKSISAEKLLEHGVLMTVIEASTVVTESEMVQVRGTGG